MIGFRGLWGKDPQWAIGGDLRKELVCLIWALFCVTIRLSTKQAIFGITDRKWLFQFINYK